MDGTVLILTTQGSRTKKEINLNRKIIKNKYGRDFQTHNAATRLILYGDRLMTLRAVRRDEAKKLKSEIDVVE